MNGKISRESASVSGSFNPKLDLARGYALVRSGDNLVRSAKQTKPGDEPKLTFHDGEPELA